MQISMTRVHELVDKYDKHFQKTLPSFMNLLWQIGVNEVKAGQTIMFHIDFMRGQNEVIIAFEEGGFQRTGVLFIEQDYNACCKILEDLNTDFFGLSIEQQEVMLGKSMQYIKQK